jgi:two-component system response regulator AtoC
MSTAKLQHEFPFSAPSNGYGPMPQFEHLIGDSAALRNVLELVSRVAAYDISVLVTGESGTGKEVVAKSIHALSPRRAGPFVSVDCAALPEALIESELFGFEEGAFTGAVERRMGRFEAAHGGVLFLDEIANLPLRVQVKLLRILQERSLSRLGSKTSFPIDVRIVAATHADLKGAIGRGEFREDLYYRLHEFNVQLPPLRARGGDTMLLAAHFLKSFNLQFGRRLNGFSPEAEEALKRHAWPGNVRELQNTIKRAAILAEGRIELSDLSIGAPAASERGPVRPNAVLKLKAATLRAMKIVEPVMIHRALQASRWNKTQTAKILKIDYKTLYNKLREYQIQ